MRSCRHVIGCRWNNTIKSATVTICWDRQGMRLHAYINKCHIHCHKYYTIQFWTILLLDFSACDAFFSSGGVGRPHSGFGAKGWSSFGGRPLTVLSHSSSFTLDIWTRSAPTVCGTVHPVLDTPGTGVSAGCECVFRSKLNRSTKFSIRNGRFFSSFLKPPELSQLDRAVSVH